MRPIYALLIPVLLLTAGCESLGLPEPPWFSDPEPDPDPAAEARAAPEPTPSPAPVPSDLWDGQRFGDVPLPKGFRIVFDKSFTHSSPGGVRIADIKYVGEVRPDEVVRFFQDEMPAYGWDFELLCGVESKMLTYVKGKEQLQVMVSEPDPGLTRVGVQLFPK